MDRAHVSSPPECANRRPLQRGPRETIDTAGLPAEALSEPETLRPAPRAVPSIPESKPLLRDPRSVSAISENVSWKYNDRLLPVKFDTQLPSAPVSLAEPHPPDGGWGWVVVFASFMVNFISDGISSSFGVFFRYLLEYIGESKFNTNWIVAIFMAMPLLSGPIASFFTNRYGCRRVTIFGSILVTIGFVISAFVENMKPLIWIFGITVGFGLSLCNLAAVVIVAYYFEKKRSLATGISVCGRGFGTFLFVPLSYMLLDLYGRRGTTLILAGIFLSMAVCGLPFRDLPWMATMNEERAKEKQMRKERKRNKRFGSSADSGSLSDRKSIAAGSAKVPKTVNIEAVTSPIVAPFSSLVDLPTYMTEGAGISQEVFEIMSNRGQAYAIFSQNYPGVKLPSRSLSDCGRLHEQSPPRAVMSPETASPGALSPNSSTPMTQEQNSSVPLTDKAALSLWLQRQATGSTKKPPAFLNDLRVHRYSLTYRGPMLNINSYRQRASSCPNIFRNSMTTIANEKVQWYTGLWDFSHFKNRAFCVFALSNFLLYMWYDVPSLYMAPSAMYMGFSASHVFMAISIMGILNIFGKIFLGWVGDWKCVNASVLYAICMLLCAGATIIMPMVGYFYSLAATSGVYGACLAANYSLTSTILVQQITLKKFPNAYGSLLLIRGAMDLIGPPLASLLFVMSDSHDLPFYLAGAFIGVSGLMLLVEPLSRCEVTQVDPESWSLSSV